MRNKRSNMELGLGLYNVRMHLLLPSEFFFEKKDIGHFVWKDYL